MRATYTHGPVTIAAECDNLTAAFEFVASVADLLSEKCGLCGSTDTLPSVQTYQGKTFRKLKCLACTATCLIFSSRENGSMWIARKDKNDQVLPTAGWSIYKKAESGQRTYQSQAQDPHPSDRPAANATGMPQSDGSEVPF